MKTVGFSVAVLTVKRTKANKYTLKNVANWKANTNLFARIRLAMDGMEDISKSTVQNIVPILNREASKQQKRPCQVCIILPSFSIDLEDYTLPSNT